MKKEVVIAIILGVCVGLIITFGVHRAQQSLQNRDNARSQRTPESVANNLQTSSPHSLILYAPEENAIYDQEEIQVSGITTENALIAVIRDSEYSTTFADNQGSFATTIKLKPGANRIIVNSHSLEGNTASTSADIVYSTVNLSPKDSSDNK